MKAATFLMSLLIPVFVLCSILIWFGVKIKRHVLQEHNLDQSVRNCIVCKILTLKRKTVRQIGRSIARMRMNKYGFGIAVTPNYQLPMYQEPGGFTGHGRRFHRKPKRPDRQFLAIPYDIRHKIYLCLLASVVSVDCIPTWVLKPNRQFLTLTNLFRTCRQTRDEFAPLFYRNILFFIYLESPFNRLYRELRLPAIHGLREIHLTIDAGSLTNAHYETLRVATNLEELYLTFKHMDTYFSCLAALDFLLGMSHLDARHNLRLFQVMVDSQTFNPTTSVQFYQEVLLAANSHWHATEDWGTPTIVSTHFKRDGRGRSRFCIRVNQKGYESSLDHRCEGLAVGNPLWEFPKVPMEGLSPENVWIQ